MVFFISLIPFFPQDFRTQNSSDIVGKSSVFLQQTILKATDSKHLTKIPTNVGEENNMAKPFVAKLGDDSNRNEDMRLAKTVDGTYLNENFGTLLDYILDPRRDELNSGYDDDESNFAQTWKDLYDKSKSEPKIEIGVSARDKDNQLVSCLFHKILGDYSDRLIKPMTGINEDGSEYNYNGIELIIADFSEGGSMRYL